MAKESISHIYNGQSWAVNQPVSLTCNGTKIPVADVTPTDTTILTQTTA